MNHHMHNHQQKLPDTSSQFEKRLTQMLDERVAHLHFTPAMRLHVMHNLSHPKNPFSTSKLALTLACLLVLLLSSSSLFYFLRMAQTPPAHPQHTLVYSLDHFIPAPAELAHGGSLISLDPTGHTLVYQPTNQPGVMYMADLNDPIQSNILVMRYAHDVTWAPDGSALATTVSPPNSQTPELALVPHGQYMHPLGQEAEATGWLPTSTQQITYTTRTPSQTHLWTITPTGTTPGIVATMGTPLHVLHMIWSPNGHQLAFIASPSQSPTQQAIYLMDAQTGALQTLLPPLNATFDALSWSPDQSHLAYSQTNTNGTSSLQEITLGKTITHLSISLQHQLLGFSWSPDSHTLVYSDGGNLLAHSLQGPPPVFPTTQDSRVNPFWLPDGRLLYLDISHGIGQLAILHPTTKK